MLHCRSGSMGSPLVSYGETQQRITRRYGGATGAARKQTAAPSIVHSSLYLPEPVYEALRRIAFEEWRKMHDVVLEGIDLALRWRGYASVESLKGVKKRS
jgi:hypothetical protein